MKNLKQIVQKAGKILEKGKRGVTIGSYVGLGVLNAMGIGGCTLQQPGPQERICQPFMFNTWVDMNGDGVFNFNEITFKEKFKKGETISIGVNIGNYSVGTPFNIRVVNPSGETVLDYINVTNYPFCVPYVELPKEKQENGVYTAVVEINGVPRATKEFTITR